jgi:hypothetical protein
MVGTKHDVWFQSRLPFGSVRILFGRGIRHSRADYSSDFLAGHPAVSGWFNEITAGAAGNIMTSTFVHQRIIGSVDDALTHGDLQIKATACPALAAICPDVAGGAISSANALFCPIQSAATKTSIGNG